jgi:hypothetical protein
MASIFRAIDQGRPAPELLSKLKFNGVGALQAHLNSTHSGSETLPK